MHGTPDWVTLKFWPAICTVAVRACVLEFCETASCTVAVPVTTGAAVVVIQEGPGETLHAQPLFVVTVKDGSDPPA